jgi:hypothetical protein
LHGERSPVTSGGLRATAYRRAHEIREQVALFVLEAVLLDELEQAVGYRLRDE